MSTPARPTRPVLHPFLRRILLDALAGRPGNDPDSWSAVHTRLRGYSLAARDDQPAAWVFLAMAQHRLGQAAEARSALAKATEWLDRHLGGGPARQAFPLAWQQQVELRLLREEAEALLREKERQ